MIQGIKYKKIDKIFIQKLLKENKENYALFVLNSINHLL